MCIYIYIHIYICVSAASFNIGRSSLHYSARVRRVRRSQKKNIDNKEN